MHFRQICGVKRSVFAVSAEWNGAFSLKTQYSRKSDYVLGFNTYLNKIFEILGLGLVFYWMMPKNWEKQTIKSRACVPLRGAIQGWEKPRLKKNQPSVFFGFIGFFWFYWVFWVFGGFYFVFYILCLWHAICCVLLHLNVLLDMWVNSV
jgi:hypothetical protein